MGANSEIQDEFFVLFSARQLDVGISEDYFSLWESNFVPFAPNFQSSILLATQLSEPLICTVLWIIIHLYWLFESTH